MTWILVKVVGNTLANENGRVRSLWPAYDHPVDGTYGPYHWEEKDPGADGGFEQIAVSGSVVSYNPTGHEGVAFWLIPLPHGDGLFMLSVDPIKVETLPLAEWPGGHA